MILLSLGYFLVSVAIVLYIYLGVRISKLWLREKRKSLKDLNIDWDRIPLIYNYVVLDGDGYLFAYATKPMFFGQYDMWASTGEKKEDWKFFIVKRISPDLHSIDYKNEILTRPGYDPALQVYQG